jgi:hypothetical protein
MKIAKNILVGGLFLLLSTHRLPAPIEEETPSPSPTPTAITTPTVAAPSKQEAARFAGNWTGRIKFGGYANEVDYTLMINQEATSLILKSPRIGEIARPASLNGNTLSWKAGPHDANLWTLTPNPDGQTAVVKAKPTTGPEGTATFQRGESLMKRGHGGGRLKNRQ